MGLTGPMPYRLSKKLMLMASRDLSRRHKYESMNEGNAMEVLCVQAHDGLTVYV